MDAFKKMQKFARIVSKVYEKDMKNQASYTLVLTAL